MKARNGFVSNSSSSSFVLLITKENFEKAWEKSDPYIRDVVEKIGVSDTTCFGKPVKRLSTWTSPGGSSIEWIEGDPDLYPEDSEYEMSSWDAWNQFQRYIDDNPEEVFSDSNDW